MRETMPTADEHGDLALFDVVESADLAGTVRDLTWRQWIKGQLIIGGSRVVEQAMEMLADEVACAKRFSFDEAESCVGGRLSRLPEPPAAG